MTVRQALGRALTVENYHVVSARNGQEALSEFSRRPADQPFDVVLLDLNPPNENPWMTVKHLAAVQPGLPVVAMTTRVEEHTLTIKARVLDALMEKPLDLPRLMDVLDQLTCQRRFATVTSIHQTESVPPSN